MEAFNWLQWCSKALGNLKEILRRGALSRRGPHLPVMIIILLHLAMSTCMTSQASTGSLYGTDQEAPRRCHAGDLEVKVHIEWQHECLLDVFTMGICLIPLCLCRGATVS